jgi:aspartate kinase
MGVPDRPGIAAAVFKSLADSNINIDMIVQNVSSADHATDISFTVSKPDGRKAFDITKKVSDTMGTHGVNMNAEVAKVSIVGVGMQSHFGVAARMFETLSKEGINIMMISTSEIKISCVIDEKETEKAVRVLHEAFELAQQ